MNRQEIVALDNGVLPASAWPGGYPVRYCDSDNETYCARCATAAGVTCITSFAIYDEGPTDYCSVCNAEIHAAYGNPEEE